MEISLSDFIYVTSVGNYIQIYYLKNGLLKNTVLRTTLKQTEEMLKDNSAIIKCHRAFLVNKDRILSVKGNSQGLRLEMDGTSEEIPVSRNFTKSLSVSIQA